MHIPVLLRESLEYLAIRPDGVYLDATAGLGGHSAAIAERLETGRLIACDRDAESLELAKTNTAAWRGRIHFYQSLFSRLGEVLSAEKIPQLDGLLADLGVSRHQLTSGERGFSLTADGPLDMRLNRAESRTAADFVNFESERNLADLIYQLGEERGSRRISRAILRARPIHTTGELARVIERAVPRTGRLHPATKTFMALRMAVNRELEELDALLEGIPRWVKPGGRAVVITFHSLEDRKVKHAFQALQREGRARVITKKPIEPGEEEVAGNAAARSAKLRCVELQGGDEL